MEEPRGRASYESLKIAHDHDEKEVRRLTPLLKAAEAEGTRLRAEVGRLQHRAAQLHFILRQCPGCDYPPRPDGSYPSHETDRAKGECVFNEIMRLTQARDEAIKAANALSRGADAIEESILERYRALTKQLVEALRRHKCCAFWSESDAAALAAAPARIP